MIFVFLNFTGYQISVQAEVEKPELYLLARCPSGEEQIMYSETRLEDIKGLSEEICVGNIGIKDIARFFKGKVMRKNLKMFLRYY